MGFKRQEQLSDNARVPSFRQREDEVVGIFVRIPVGFYRPSFVSFLVREPIIFPDLYGFTISNLPYPSSF
jgi:hypothetical protein